MELEAANSKGNSRKFFQIVKSMTRKFQLRLQGIQSATGENLTQTAQLADRWKRVLGARASTTSFRGCSCHPSDSKSQTTGPDEVPAKLFKAGGETVLDRMHIPCVAIWDRGMDVLHVHPTSQERRS